tara:strand:- start:4414 stop:5121 length:708 start_codon:yes stop_codon:yes gene_type:complete
MKAEYMYHSGDDLAVVNAAKVSFDKESEWASSEFIGEDWDAYYNEEPESNKVLHEKDKKLINYLATHNHWTPFAHNSITLRMQAPVPIRTQCFKHKSGFVENEESRRYISGGVDLYTPKELRMSPAVGQSKQGSHGVHDKSNYWLRIMSQSMHNSVEVYEILINTGICPEQSRLVLPQGAEVNWVWTGSLAAYARFYGLRSDPHAQLEIQMLAGEVGKLIQPLFPVSWDALTKKD